MVIAIPKSVLAEIGQHGEKAYPEETAGFLFGADGGQRRVERVFQLENSREEDARRNRYLITPDDMLSAEKEANRLGVEIIGVFHSHPDHRSQPSSYDLEWALPWFSYLITTVQSGKAQDSRAWRLKEDRSGFTEEEIKLEEG